MTGRNRAPRYTTKLPPLCSIEGCSKKAKARSWCEAHYSRWRNNGDPLGGSTGPGEAQRYFYGVVLRHQTDECLTWPFARGSNGYGVMTSGRGLNGSAYVHRIVCQHVNGPAPSPSHHAAHTCGNGHQGCVNPRHLSWKTPKENEADKAIHGTLLRGAKHGSAKLTESQVREIRSVAGKMPYRILAERYGMSAGAVCDVANGKRWGHII